jgi:hypothetical protein
VWRGIGVLEVAVVVGPAVGLAVPVLGIATAVGLFLLLIGAIGTHARSPDLSNARPSDSVGLTGTTPIGHHQHTANNQNNPVPYSWQTGGPITLAGDRSAGGTH